MVYIRRQILVLCIAVVAVVAVPVIGASRYYPARIDQDEYWQLVQETSTEIQRLEGLSDEELQTALVRLAGRWEAITEVDIDGQATPINNMYLARQMRAVPPNLAKIQGYLASLLEAHQDYPSLAFSSEDLATLRLILSQPEFAWPEPAPNPFNEWLLSVWADINRWLNDLLGGRSFNIPIDQNLATALASLLLAAVIFLVFRTLFADFAREARMANHGDDEDAPLTSEVAFERAQRLSSVGDYRSAVRYLYLSALLIMDERGVLHYDRSKTNREYLRSVAGAPDLSEPLGEVIDVFDNVWYGFHALDETDFRHYSDRVEELKEKKA